MTSSIPPQKIQNLETAITAFEAKSFWYPSMHKIESLVQEIIQDSSIGDEDKKEYLRPLIFRVSASINPSNYCSFFFAIRAFFRIGAFGEGSLSAQRRIVDLYEAQILKGNKCVWEETSEMGSSSIKLFTEAEAKDALFKELNRHAEIVIQKNGEELFRSKGKASAQEDSQKAIDIISKNCAKKNLLSYLYSLCDQNIGAFTIFPLLTKYKIANQQDSKDTNIFPLITISLNDDSYKVSYQNTLPICSTESMASLGLCRESGEIVLNEGDPAKSSCRGRIERVTE